MGDVGRGDGGASRTSSPFCLLAVVVMVTENYGQSGSLGMFCDFHVILVNGIGLWSYIPGAFMVYIFKYQVPILALNVLSRL